MLAIRLPTEIEQRLDQLAKTTGRTKTFYAREAILRYLDDLEDLYLAEQRLIDNQAGRSRTYTWRRWNTSLAWRIEFDAGALKDLRSLDRQVVHRITRFLRERLAQTDDPRMLGAPLRNPMSGAGATPLWRYRVGDWRIIVRIEDEVLRILVLRVAHRREVYRRTTRTGAR